MTSGEPVDGVQRRAINTNVSLADPSEATISLLLREIASLKELTSLDISNIKDAIRIAHEDVVRFPTAIQEAVANIEQVREAKIAFIIEKFNVVDKTFDVHNEKFTGIYSQFSERDKRAEQTSKDSKTAIDAALLAAKEAVGKQQEANDKATSKSDSSLTKQIDQQAALMHSIKSELDSRITDVKDRFTAFQAASLGRSEEKVDRRGDNSLWTAIAGLVLALMAFAAGTFLGK